MREKNSASVLLSCTLKALLGPMRTRSADYTVVTASTTSNRRRARFTMLPLWQHGPIDRQC